MKLEKTGKNTSQAEVSNISPNGIWLLLEGEELFLPFETFPWFQKATISAVMDVELPHDDHLYWPQLDIDLSVASIRNPEKFPLVSKVPKV